MGVAQGEDPSGRDWLPSLSEGMPGRIGAFEPSEARPGESLSAEKLSYHATNILSWLLPATKMAKVGEAAELAARLGTAAKLEQAPALAAKLPRALPRLAGFLTRVGTEAVGGAGMGMIQSGGEDTVGRDASIGAGAYTLQAMTRALFSLKFSPQLVGQLIKPTKEQLAFGANPVEGILKEKIVGATLEDLVTNISDRVKQLDEDAISLITKVPQYRAIVLPEARQQMEAVFKSSAALAAKHRKTAAARQILYRGQAYLDAFDEEVAKHGGRASLAALLEVRRFMQKGVNWAKPGLSKAIEGKTPVVTQAGIAVDEAIVEAYKALNTLMYQATGSVKGKAVGRLQSLFQREHNLLAARDSVDGTLVEAAQKAWSRNATIGLGAGGFGVGAAVSAERQLTANERISPTRVITDALVGAMAGAGAGKAIAGTRALFSSTPAITARANFYRGLWPKVEPPPIDLPAPVSIDLPESQLPKAIPVRTRGGVEEIVAVPPGLTAMEEAEFLERAGALKSIPGGSVRHTTAGVPETMPKIGARQPVPYDWSKPGMPTDVENLPSTGILSPADQESLDRLAATLPERQRERVIQQVGALLRQRHEADMQASRLFSDFPASPPDRGMDEITATAERLGVGRPVSGLETAGVPETMPPIGTRPPVPPWAGGLESRLKAGSGEAIAPKPPAGKPPAAGKQSASKPPTPAASNPAAPKSPVSSSAKKADAPPAAKPTEGSKASKPPAAVKPDVTVPAPEAFTSDFKAGDRVVIRVAGRNRPLRGKVVGPANSKTPALTVATDSGQYSVPLSAIQADAGAPPASLGMRPSNRRLPGGED